MRAEKLVGCVALDNIQENKNILKNIELKVPKLYNNIQDISGLLCWKENNLKSDQGK